MISAWLPVRFWVPAFRDNKKCFLLSSYFEFVFIIVCLEPLGKTLKQSIPHCVFLLVVFWRKRY